MKRTTLKFSGLETLCAIVTFAIIMLPNPNSGAAVLEKRSTEVNEENETEICIHDSPCGWEVYDAFSRKTEYYVTSTCTCRSEEKCVLMSDDLQISSYVYNCRVIPVRRSSSRRSGRRTHRSRFLQSSSS